MPERIIISNLPRQAIEDVLSDLQFRGYQLFSVAFPHFKLRSNDHGHIKSTSFALQDALPNTRYLGRINSQSVVGFLDQVNPLNQHSESFCDLALNLYGRLLTTMMRIGDAPLIFDEVGNQYRMAGGVEVLENPISLPATIPLNNSSLNDVLK